MPRGSIRLVKRARIELQKARNLLLNLEEMPKGSVKRYIRFLLSAMSLVGEALIQSEKTRSENPLGGLDKTLLEKHKLESRLYDLYFYLKNMLHKETERVGDQVQVKSWKSSKTLSKEDLRDFYSEVKDFIEKVESEVTH